MYGSDNLNPNKGGQMPAMDKLFVQIFETKKRIIDQVKRQIDLFDHHLASICVLDGIAPPPWLLPPSFPSVSSDFNDIRKEDLISGLLLQHSQSVNPHFNCQYSLYQEPIVTARNKGIPNASCSEVYASNNEPNAGDTLSSLKPSPTDDTQCTFNGVPEQDGSVTSPPDCTDARLSDNCEDPYQSLVKIQRSKSRQRALELRSRSKANKQKSCEENHAGPHNSQGTDSKNNPILCDLADEVGLTKHASNEFSKEKLKSKESAGKEMNSDIDYGGIIRSGSCSQQIDSVNEIGNDGNLSCIADNDSLNKPLYCPLLPLNCVNGSTDPSVVENSSSVAVANLVGSKNNSIVCCDKMTESWTSISHANTLKKPFEGGYASCVAEVDDENKTSLEKSVQRANSESEALKLFKSSPVISNKSSKVRKASERDEGIEEKDDNISVGRITRSRSSQSQVKCMNEHLEMGKSQSSNKENRVPKTKQISHHAHELLELVTSIDTTNVSCGWEAKVRSSQKVDAGKSANGCGIAVSSSDNKRDDFSKSPVIGLCSNVSCGREAKVRSSQKVDAGKSAHGCGIAASSSDNKRDDFSKSPGIGLCSDALKDSNGVFLQSLGKSSQPPKSTSFVEEGVNLLIPSDIQSTSPPPTESTVAENVMCSNGIAKTCSVTSKSNSAGSGCGVERSESMPAGGCALVVEPQQLDFNDVGDNCLLKPSTIELENKQEGTPEKQISPLLLSMDGVTLDDFPEKPSIPNEIALQKELNVSSKIEKVRKVSSEAILADSAALVKERTLNCAQLEMGSFISKSSSADVFFMDSSPQQKRMKIGSQLTDCKYPSLMVNPCPPSNQYHMGDALQFDATTRPVEGAGGDVESRPNFQESEVNLSQLHDYEEAINLEGKGGVDTLAPLIEQAAASVASLNKLTAGFSQDYFLDNAKVADPEPTISDSIRQHTAEDNQVLLQVSNTKDTVPETRYHFEAEKSLSPVTSGALENLPVGGTDQNMPIYEGFLMDSDSERPSTTNEGFTFDELELPPAIRRPSALNQLFKSTSLCTPISHSTEYDFHKALNLYHSIPNGLLEGMELGSMLNIDGDESERLDSNYSSLNEGLNNDLLVRSQSDSSSSLLNAQLAFDISVPCISPVGKFWDVMPPKSGSSGKRVSSIPELPSISEENENADGIVDMLLEDSCPQMEMDLVEREALADIRKNSNTLMPVSEVEMHDERSSIASVNTVFGYSGTCNKSKRKLTDHNRRRYMSKGKENQNISLGGEGGKSSKGPLRGRFSKPKLSEKPGTSKGGPSLSEKEPKRNNIVSNITSFIPLVQQKQVAGKRDIKVKALEAAEAAKRLAEKKENERKMKKEALKIERAKIEEANLRQLELEKKKKEEEKKKKDADMAAKKRQREEEERKEKERKKMRLEEAKRNHQENEKKLQKEAKTKAPDERAHGRKELKKMEKASVDENLQTVPGTKPATIENSTSGTINANISMEDHEALCGDNSKVMGKPSDNHSLVSNVDREQSYEISPYKGSDDEDEDEEATRENKYKPSWARKSQLALAVSAQQSIDPKLVFPPERCCSTSKVILPRRFQQIW